MAILAATSGLTEAAVIHFILAPGTYRLRWTLLLASFLVPLHAVIWHQVRRRAPLAWMALVLQVVYLGVQIGYTRVFGAVLSLPLAMALLRESSEVARLGGIGLSPWAATALAPVPAFLWWIRPARVRIPMRAAWLLLPCLVLATTSASINPSVLRPFGRKHVMARLGVLAFESIRLWDTLRRPPLVAGPVSVPRRSDTHPNILVLQIESLDARLPFLEWNGQPIMPRLRAWCDSGAFFPYLRAYHGVGGSSEADFASVYSIVPPPDVAPFLADFPTSHALPRLLRSAGYRSAFVHGNLSEFWGRNEVFRNAGFDDLLFEERFPTKRPDGYWWGRPDHQTYEVASRWIGQDTTRPWYIHLVTMTSHEPFALHRALKLGYGYPSTALGDLLSSFRYVDSTTGSFLDSVRADGRTWVLLFGDHAPPQDFVKGFTSTVLRQKGTAHEFVPLLVLPPPGHPRILLDSTIVASTLDILPTVASLSGVSESIHAFGLDLLAPFPTAAILPEPTTGLPMDRRQLRGLAEAFHRSREGLHEDPSLRQGSWRDLPGARKTLTPD